MAEGGHGPVVEPALNHEVFQLLLAGGLLVFLLQVGFVLDVDDGLLQRFPVIASHGFIQRGQGAAQVGQLHIGPAQQVHRPGFLMDFGRT